MITQEQLKRELRYDPETGHFWWIRQNEAGGFKRDLNTPVGRPNIVNGYIQIWVKKKCFTAHRLAFLYMTGAFPSNAVDHINRVRTDNRWCNLRTCTSAENNQNKKYNSGSRLLGTRPTAQGTWATKISINNMQYHIGTFQSEEEAHLAYLVMKHTFHTFYEK